MISDTQFSDICAQIRDQQILSDDTAIQLRQNFPDIHFTYCMDDDVAHQAKPVYEHPRFNVYLVDSREHCLSLTNDLEIATGIVVAEIWE